MAYQEVKQTSYGTRVKNSFGGIATGFVMFLAATALLWWNEGRAVKTAKMLEEAQGNYVTMTDIKNVDPQFEGKLVFATGSPTTTDTLTDPLFGVHDNALKIERKVEYYQWEEHAREEKRDKLGGGEETITTYTYKKAWVSQPLESGAFHDPQYQNSNFVLTTAENTIYVGLTPSAPAIGDVRITFTKAAPQSVSLLARVSGTTFTSYTAKNGKSFSSITTGTKTADEMFQAEHDSNNLWTWGLRLAGIFLAIGGLKAIFGFLETLLKVIPPLAGLLGLGVRLICSVVGFVWSLLVIALAWLFYRPLLGIILLVVGVGIIFAFSKKGKKLIAQHIMKKGQATPQPGQAPAPQAAANPQPPATPQKPQPSAPKENADDAWT